MLEEGAVNEGSDINLAKEIRNKNKRLLDAELDELMPIEQKEKFVLEGKRHQILERKRITIFQNTILCWICQQTLCFMILLQIVLVDEMEILAFLQYRTVIFARFVASLILHIAMMEEVRRGLTKMKYAINHPHNFDNWGMAFTAALLQTENTIVVEFICLAVISFQ